MTTVDALLPCRLFDVEVSLGAHDGLSVVEQFLLRAIATAATTVDELATAFALPQRLVLDTLIDLLGRGLVDTTDDGRLEAHASVLGAMGDPAQPKPEWFKRFQSANLPEPQVLHLVQDLVAGEVFRATRFPQTDRAGLPAMPESAFVPEIADIPRTTLLAAVTHALRDKGGADATRGGLREELARIPTGARVLEVHPRRAGPVGGPSSHIAFRRAMLPIQLIGEERGEDQPPRIAVTSPVTIPRWVRKSIASALDSLWHQGYGRGPGQFFERIESRLIQSPTADRDMLATPAEILRQFQASFSSSDAPEQQHLHRAVACDHARPALEYLASHACRARVVEGTAGTFRAEAIAALNAARQQVVLACPWLRELGRAVDMQEAVRGALQRGVNVVLVWGIRSDAHEEDDAQPFLSQTEIESRSWPGALVLASKSAQSHAKAIIQDLDIVTVCSANFLNATATKRGREVGVQIMLGDGNRVSLPAQSVLTGLRRLIPDYIVQARCLQAPLVFGREEATAPFTIGPRILPPQLDIGEIGVHTWQTAWDATRDHLVAAAESARTAAEPIFDAQHRELFVWATATGARRIGIASHRVSPHGLSDQVAGHLLAALGRGAVVRLSFDSDEANDMDPIAQERINRLCAAGAQAAILPTHAKFLVCDDWAIVSSYNFLSADPTLRSAHELGVRLFDPTLVEELWRLLDPARDADLPATT
jgi:phosphatidylserine/phosphatidylglycerophosphate/cardiolipin synthase-like enzyme